jgi:ELWxxDGT repeat protein
MVALINPSGSADPGGGAGRPLTEFNGLLYFSATDGSTAHGEEMWQSDGTAAGTSLVADIFPGPGSSFASQFTVSGGLLFFEADDGTNGAQLWRFPGPAGAPVPVAAPASPPAARLAKPVISGAHQSHSTWREGSKLAHASGAAAAAKRRPPVGTTFSFRVNEQATVAFAFTRRVVGRRAGRRCVAKTRSNAHRKPCKRTVTAGTLSFAARAGARKVTFQGRLSRGKRLPLGRYTLLITATNAEKVRSAPVGLTFTIVK